MKKLSYLGCLFTIFICADIIRIDNNQVINLDDVLSQDSVDVTSLDDMLSQAKNDGLDGISFTDDKFKSANEIPISWWNDYIIRFDNHKNYYIELISSKEAERRKMELCKESSTEPGVVELLKSEANNTYRLMIFSKDSQECIGGAVIEMQTKFQPYLTLLALYVLPAYRSKGFSNILLDKISYLANALKAKGVRLQPFPLGSVSMSKDELIHWYERRGYFYPPNPTRFSYMINDSLVFKTNNQERITVLK